MANSDTRTFDGYETLTCEMCNKPFEGRRPSPGATTICPACLTEMTEPVVEDGAEISADVMAEFSNGEGGEENAD